VWGGGEKINLIIRACVDPGNVKRCWGLVLQLKKRKGREKKGQRRYDPNCACFETSNALLECKKNMAKDPGGSEYEIGVRQYVATMIKKEGERQEILTLQVKRKKIPSR